MSNNTEWEEEERSKFTRGDSGAPPEKIFAISKNGYVICQQCGREMRPEDLSKNKYTARKEIKWQMHMACVSNVHKMIDMDVPGLIAERSAKKDKDKPAPKTKAKSFAQMRNRK